MADSSWQGDVAVFAFDIVGYGKRSNADQLDVKNTTEDALKKASAKATEIRAQGWTAWADAGDGGYLLLSGDPRQALEVLEAFVGEIERYNKKARPEWQIDLRYALNYGPAYSKADDGSTKLVGNAINDCARLLDGMKRYQNPTGRVVASGAYKVKALQFGQLPDGLVQRLHDIEDKHGDHHEVWNARKLPGFGLEPAPQDLHDPR